MKKRRQPFQDSVDTSIFFGGGARREIVDDIKTAINDEVTLLTLTGTDGSGKTMICRMVEQELNADADLLFFDQGTESFDEVVKRIAEQVDLEETEELSDRNSRLEKAVEILSQQNRRLIIILDGAENIFPATLERLRRMMDQVNTERLSLQLLFSGRPLFLLNFKQLGIIAFKTVKEKHFSLDPLDGKDTYLYLNHSLDVSDTDEQKRFSLAQAVEIADIARGNFRLINQLAGKFLELKKLASDKNAALDEESGDEASDSLGIHSRLSTGLGNVDLDFLKVPRMGVRWYAAGAAFVALILIIVLYWGRDDKEIESIPESENVPELTLEKVEPDSIDIPQPSQPVEPLQPPMPAVAPEEPQLLVEKVDPPEAATELVEERAVPGNPEIGTEETLETALPDNQVSGQAIRQTSLPDETQNSENLAEQQTSQETLDESSAELLTSQETQDESSAEQLTSQETQEESSAELLTSQETQDESSAELLTIQEAQDESSTELLTSQETQEDSLAELSEIAKRAENIEAAPVQAKEESAVVEIVSGDDEPDRSSEEVQVEAPAEQRQELPEPENLLEEPRPIQNTASSESLKVPNLAVPTKKVPLIESESLEVVTLKSDSKKRPDQTAVSAPPAEPNPNERKPAQSSSDEPQPPAVVEKQVEPAVTGQQMEQVASIEQTADDYSPLIPISPKQLADAKDSGVYYAQRLAAGSRWLVGGSRNKYTIQLMVLNSQDAQQNVRYMLSHESYQPIIDQLYILRKSGQPQTVMLYWGEFDSPDEARQAKDQLPDFLSRLEPFEVPVKDAVTKARAGL